jgi:hypothetical protein
MRLLSIPVAFVAMTSCAQVLAQASLCSPAEVTYFSCSVDAKLVSLCGSKDLTSTPGVLQYRFGKQGAVELMYPTSAAKAKGAFKSYRYSFAKGGVAVLGFRIGKYSYSLFETRSVHGYNGAGVTVTRDGSPAKVIECTSLSAHPSRFFYELGDWHVPEAVHLHYIGPER